MSGGLNDIKEIWLANAWGKICCLFPFKGGKSVEKLYFFPIRNLGILSVICEGKVTGECLACCCVCLASLIGASSISISN